MSPLNKYNIYFSVAWSKSETYNNVLDLLAKVKYFRWKNYSLVEFDPSIDNAKVEFTNAIINQIKDANIIILISDLYKTHQEWIDEEIKIAEGFDKSIIAIKPQEGEEIPLAIKNVAKEVAAWKELSIINNIEKYAKKN